MPEQLFEIARRQIDTPEFRGIEFIEVEAKRVINRVPGGAMPFDWTINPYRGCTHACVYCFARSTHTYLDMDAGRDFETKIVVKVNAPDVLRRELAAPRWNGEHIAMGTATDPYQRAEGRYRLMPRIIEVLTERRNPFSILTKGTLILRDLDLLVRAREVTDVSTAFSIGTVDEDAWRRTEPGTPHPRARLEAVAALNDAGVPCSVLVAPILPGITDAPAQLRAVVSAAIDAGATADLADPAPSSAGHPRAVLPVARGALSRAGSALPGDVPTAVRAAVRSQGAGGARREHRSERGRSPPERSGRRDGAIQPVATAATVPAEEQPTQLRML